MSKSVDILMAGVTAGIVTFTTTQLGIGGTILGAVIGSMLYQVISIVMKEPSENVKTKIIERDIFYVFPLVIILVIEVIYLLAALFYGPQQIFFALESATGDNLFKALGIGLIIMGLYPIIQPESIKESHGYILLIIGIINLLIGFSDVNSLVAQLYAPLLYQLKEYISLVMIAAIIYIIIDVARASMTITLDKDKNKELNENQDNE